MKIHLITESEWKSFITLNCIYRDFKIEPEMFSVYVNKWLSVRDKKIIDLFGKENSLKADDLVFGNCKFVFKNYSEIRISISPYVKNQNGDAVWFDEKIMKYIGNYKGEIKNYGIEGTLEVSTYLPAWVDIECNTECCELHIL